MPKRKSAEEHPASEQIRSELNRVENGRRFIRVLRNTFSVFVSIAAVAVLLSVFLLPVMRIYGNAMTPTVSEGEIVIGIKTKEPERGDIIGFYYNNRILLRRVIALPGEMVEVDSFGNVKVNSRTVAEAYVFQKTLGASNIEYPFRVPDGAWFVMGDNRLTSIDSRNTAVGCVTEDQLVGKVFACVWPFQSIRWFGADFIFI